MVPIFIGFPSLNIPLYLSHTVKQIIGKSHVEKIVLAKVDEKFNFIPGTEIEFECDTLLLSVDLDAVRPKVPSLVTPVVFTNLGDKAIELKKTGSVTHGEASILEIK